MDSAPPATPLRYETPKAWVACVLATPLALLNDHAHLERKATSNALDLLGRWPVSVDVVGPLSEPGADRWSAVLASIARDEARHLSQVLRILMARGGHFQRSHANPYAASLRGLVRKGQAQEELLDRLLVSALIEARSGERFRLLAEHAEDKELASLYGALVASEEGHYRAFLELARLVPGLDVHVDARWETLVDLEAECIQATPPGPGMHSGPAVSAS